MKQVITLKPGAVTIADLSTVIAGAAAELDPESWPKVEAAGRIVADAANGAAAVYGVSTAMLVLSVLLLAESFSWGQAIGGGGILLGLYLLQRKESSR